MKKKNSVISGEFNKNHEICLRCGASRTSLKDMLAKGGKGNLTIVRHILENCPACKKALGDTK